MTNAAITGPYVDVDLRAGLAALAAAQTKDDFASWLANVRARAVPESAPSDVSAGALVPRRAGPTPHQRHNGPRRRISRRLRRTTPVSASPRRPAPRLALSRSEAAAALGMSLRHFQRHVHRTCNASIRASYGSTRSPNLSAGYTSRVGATGPQRRRCRTCQAKTPRPDIKGYSPVTSSIARSGTDDPVPASPATTVPSTIAPASGTSRRSGRRRPRQQETRASTSPRPLSVAKSRPQMQSDCGRAPAVRGGCSGRQGAQQHGHRYKPRAIDNVDESLRLHVEPALGNKRLSDIRRGDMQAIVDELAPRLSGSRVRSVVNAVRSLYRWAQDRDLAGHDPAALVRLPAMDATPIERVASPADFADLLAALPLDKALPYALAGYGRDVVPKSCGSAGKT